MIKLASVIISLTLVACAGSPDLRPEMDVEGESLLRSGVIAYESDDFLAARQKFHTALGFYQGLDDTDSIQLSRINLIATSLALGDFHTADAQLNILKSQANDGLLDERFEEKVVMLEVKLLFLNQQYAKALETLSPLLSGLGKNGIIKHKDLSLLAAAARLETLVSGGTESLWLDRFRAALARHSDPVQPEFQSSLKRIDATIAAEQRQYSEALRLMQEALGYYKSRADRRSIASCLEEIADIQAAQHHKRQAFEYLERALNIRSLLNDQFHSDRIRQKLVLMNQES